MLDNIKIKTNGFTLAEVLITLAIIGIVAALTIPTVIRNYQERQVVTSVKKAYNTLFQAFKLAEIENGAIDTWDQDAPANVIEMLRPHLKIIKKCNSGTKGCWAEKYYTLQNTEAYNKDASCAQAILADGTFLRIYSSNNAGCKNDQSQNQESKYLQSVCAELYIDINGNKKPNSYGRDIFLFWITKYGVIPMGTKDEKYWRINNTCSRISASVENGGGCAAWVIKNGNMDYLKKQISW